MEGNRGDVTVVTIGIVKPVPEDVLVDRRKTGSDVIMENSVNHVNTAAIECEEFFSRRVSLTYSGARSNISPRSPIRVTSTVINRGNINNQLRGDNLG